MLDKGSPTCDEYSMSLYSFSDAQMGSGYVLCSNGELMTAVAGHCAIPPQLDRKATS